jgi:hypothetical protein
MTCLAILKSGKFCANKIHSTQQHTCNIKAHIKQCLELSNDEIHNRRILSDAGEDLQPHVELVQPHVELVQPHAELVQPHVESVEGVYRCLANIKNRDQNGFMCCINRATANNNMSCGIKSHISQCMSLTPQECQERVNTLKRFFREKREQENLRQIEEEERLNQLDIRQIMENEYDDEDYYEILSFLGRQAPHRVGRRVGRLVGKTYTSLGEDEMKKNCSCSICFDDYTHNSEVVITRCGHSYCSGCINGWVSTGKKTCPLCRAEVI